MITVKANSTFSFRKLENELDSVFDGFSEGFNKSLVRDAQNFIQSGKVKTAGHSAGYLAESTKKQRIRQGYSPTPPLFKSGLLVDTLEGTKEGILMQKYAQQHRLGINRPVREFLFTGKGNLRASMKKENKKMVEALIKNINKVMKVRGTGSTGSLRAFLNR